MIPHRPARPRLPLLVAAVALLPLVASCGGPVTLDGALGQIPVFEPATLKERTTAFTSDDFGDPTKFSSYTWYMETKSRYEAVDSFYVAQWPAAGRTEDEEQIIIRNPPFPANEDAPLGESVLITIKKARAGGLTQFTIDEDVFRARRR